MSRTRNRGCQSLQNAIASREVVVEDNMNFKFLKAQIESDVCVKRQLNTKLEELRCQIELVSRIPFRHEAFTLLKHCTSICKVNHLLRTLPPVQNT